MEKSNSIGGYLSLEISQRKSSFHKEALALNTGRNAFEHILMTKKYPHVYIPYFTCDAVLEPLEKTNTPYSFYSLDQNFQPILNGVQEDSAILYNNYFGLTGHVAKSLSLKYNNLIVDNAQAFYDMPLDGVPTFYSPRKFFGLPDGGLVYCPGNLTSENYQEDQSHSRMRHLIDSIELGKESCYVDFQRAEEGLKNQETKRMSKFTQDLLGGIDYEEVQKKRLENFRFYHAILGNSNEFTPLIQDSEYVCPMVYPYLPKEGEIDKRELIEKGIYVATYWPNVLQWAKQESFEYDLASKGIFLPIDQRYNPSELKVVIKALGYE